MNEDLIELLESGLSDFRLTGLQWVNKGEDLVLTLREPGRNSAGDTSLSFRWVTDLRVDLDFGEYLGAPLIFNAIFKSNSTKTWSCELTFGAAPNGAIRFQCSDIFLEHSLWLAGPEFSRTEPYVPIDSGDNDWAAKMHHSLVLVENHDAWELPLGGRVVTRCLVDSAFGLLFSDGEVGVELKVEGPFALSLPGSEEIQLNPEEVGTLAPALRLFNKEVHLARAYKHGELWLEFTCGSSLEVPPDNRYESWGIVGEGWRIVSGPGRELSIWR